MNSPVLSSHLSSSSSPPSFFYSTRSELFSKYLHEYGRNGKDEGV
jgi:hypothetical protein